MRYTSECIFTIILFYMTINRGWKSNNFSLIIGFIFSILLYVAIWHCIEAYKLKNKHKEHKSLTSNMMMRRSIFGYQNDIAEYQKMHPVQGSRSTFRSMSHRWILLIKGSEFILCIINYDFYVQSLPPNRYANIFKKP